MSHLRIVRSAPAPTNEPAPAPAKIDLQRIVERVGQELDDNGSTVYGVEGFRLHLLQELADEVRRLGAERVSTRTVAVLFAAELWLAAARKQEEETA